MVIAIISFSGRSAIAGAGSDTTRMYVLDPVTVTGTSLEALRSSVPNAVSVVSREDIRRSGYETNGADNATKALADYTTLAARVTYTIVDGLDVHVAGENLTDVSYQTMWDYAMPGRTLQMGVRWGLR